MSLFREQIWQTKTSPRDQVGLGMFGPAPAAQGAPFECLRSVVSCWSKGQKPHLLHSSPYQETPRDFYFSLILHFCNCYSIKMINESIKLEPNPRGRVSPPASREPAPGTGHALLSRGNLPFPGAGRHSRHGCCKPGWWESSRQVLVLHWISTLRAGVLDVHVKLLFLTC